MGAKVATRTLQLVAAVSNGIATSQTLSGAGNLTLNGSLVTSGVASFDVPRRVVIASSGADGALTWTITGTDRYGNVLVNTLTGVTNTASRYTASDFATVNSIRGSGATAGDITAGTNTVASTEWVIDDPYVASWALGGSVAGPSGTTYTLEHTYDDPNRTGTSLVVQPFQWSQDPSGNTPPVVWPNLNVANASGDNEFTYPDHPIFAHRLTINSGTGLVVMQSLQSGLGSR